MGEATSSRHAGRGRHPVLSYVAVGVGVLLAIATSPYSPAVPDPDDTIGDESDDHPEATDGYDPGLPFDGTDCWHYC